MTAIAKQSMTDATYSQLTALRKNSHSARECVEKVVFSLMEEFNCSRRRAALLATKVWAELECVGLPAAYIDVSHTTGNAVVIHDTGTGRTSVFSIRELLQLRDSASAVSHIQA
jgi:hypothetical protein